MYERLIQKLMHRNVGALASTLSPTGGWTSCTVETGSFPKTYDGYTTTYCCFKTSQTCLSEWYWDNPVNVTKFNILSLYYTLNSRINGIWGRVAGSWVKVWDGTWIPTHNFWDSRAITCNNCTGIRISQTHDPQASRPCIVEVTVDYEVMPEEGFAVITDIEKPSSFIPGVGFDINVTIRNDGGDDDFFDTILNRDTGEVLSSGGTYILSGTSNTLYHVGIVLQQTTDFHGRVEAGHIE